MSKASTSDSSIARFRGLGSFSLPFLGFRFAPPQALCFHPLRGFWTLSFAVTCSELCPGLIEVRIL
jgi:hypothetical protein